MGYGLYTNSFKTLRLLFDMNFTKKKLVQPVFVDNPNRFQFLFTKIGVVLKCL